MAREREREKGTWVTKQRHIRGNESTSERVKTGRKRGALSSSLRDKKDQREGIQVAHHG